MLTHQQHRTDGPRGGPITGGQVVPSHWRNTPQGGPMPLAGDTIRGQVDNSHTSPSEPWPSRKSADSRASVRSDGWRVVRVAGWASGRRTRCGDRCSRTD